MPASLPQGDGGGSLLFADNDRYHLIPTLPGLELAADGPGHLTPESTEAETPAATDYSADHRRLSFHGGRHPHDAPLAFSLLHAELAAQDMYPSSGIAKHLRKSLFGVGVFASCCLIPKVLFRRVNNNRRCDEWTFREEVGVELLRYMLNNSLDVARKNTGLIESILLLNPFRVRLNTVDIVDVNEQLMREPTDIEGWLRMVGSASITAQLEKRRKRSPRKTVAHWIGCDPPTDDSYRREKEAGIDPGLVLLYFHGGGYTVGSALFMIMSFTSILNSLKKRHPDARVRICAVDYPLAPEAAFPSAIDCAVTAYRWLLRQPGMSDVRIAVGGDSAGGGLALALVQKLRFVQPASLGSRIEGLALVSPWVDVSLSGASILRNEATDIIRPSVARNMIRFYLTGGVVGPEADTYLERATTHPMVSAVWADLRGFPDMFVLGGGKELFYDDLVKFVERARVAGVNVETEFSDHMVHAYIHMEPFFGKRASEGIQKFADFLARLSVGPLPPKDACALDIGLVQA